MRRIIGFGILALSILSACESEHSENHHSETVFTATTALRVDTALSKEYVSQIHSIRHIELRALERGYLQHIYVDEGDQVKEGQLLFRIMPNIYKAELEKAKAEAELARIEYENTKSLADRDVVSSAELAMAKARYTKAKAELSLAETHMSFTEIKAPFGGIIDRFHVREGSLIDEGELLSTLSDNSEMWVYFNVPEAEYLDYQERLKEEHILPVQLRMANDRIFQHEGKVSAIEADFDNETGNIPFRATFANPSGLLRHGETGNIIMQDKLESALIIPQKATFEILDKHYVFVIDEEHVVHLRELKVAHELEDLYLISGGLLEGEHILLEGLRKVRNGDHINFELKDPKAVWKELKLYAE
ncbi:efflux RND transporter periplasmic adaptor subunit [Croceimicrobium hydrocarbonivorans]|uniref:Efflux RND transporter periplasmic adaptor subunit n=1 Tax=Croceimicrobium hydrocarbonivorans TaxID=2761580 RepID=A0A7H0VJ45_9FLAO|nr:efflux RND transporter periplasmic adaptor subunit [Croceimicrobium hydrocarbonivorans]QNR25743.1 efflux RND transporter periplasmic adaptor subunit [Croceimicrobium hydrocarbonivorans]